ncbi:MAG: penicillin-binding protein [Fusobacterium sp.]|uniref:penicillin-binding protein n=1 Tax=Fusobacterium sp. TaxID=68766 RepID=UPI0026DBE9BB|nr:penicillin-binding protein [Fusobacterium sp.]MDO4690153.1 penicillin-binding protein [Fusobacterium sp.]
MFRIFTKEKKSKELFNINLTKEEVRELMHDNLFLDYPHIKKEDCIVIEREEPFKNPTFADGIIREMTREELVENDILIPLELGEKIVDKKIIKVPKPDDKNYWNWDGENWVYDNDQEKKEYFNRIDEIKAKSLAYGFDYKINGQEHRQRCRDKDIALMAASLIELIAEKLIGNDKATSFWYFEDNYEWEVDLKTLTLYARYGKTFTTSVYKTENYFKTQVIAKKLSEQEFENKRKEIHNELVKGS